MAENLEDKVADAHGEGKKEEKKAPSGWESGWKEIKEGASVAANLSIAAGANLLSMLKYGVNKGLVLTSSFPIGAALHEYARADGKGNFTSAKARDESIAGLAFTALAVPGVAATLQIPKAFGLENVVTDVLGYELPMDALAVAGTTFFVLNPLLNLAYYPIQHLIHQKTFKGMWTSLKNEYLPSLKRTWWLNALTSGVMAATYANPVLTPLLFPYFALSGIAYRVLMSPEPIDYKKLAKGIFYSPLYAASYLTEGAASVANKISKSMSATVYSIGSWFDKLITPAGGKAASPTQAPAGAAPALQPA